MNRLSIVGAFGLLLTTSSAAALTPDDWLAVELKCPNEAGGVLELIEENILGEGIRYRAFYAGRKATQVSVEGSDRGSEFEMVLEYDLETIDSAGERAMADTLLSVTSQAQTDGCFPDGTVNPSYLAKLAANRERLRNESE